MSFIFVDTGQCGNQLGCSIIDSLYHHVNSDPMHMDAFFRTSINNKQYARAVCIDTEPKVINDCIQKSRERNWLFDVKGVVYR
jgi:hypothetical protein